MLVFSFISAPSGDEKSIMPLINPPAPIKINNSRNIHNENGVGLLDLSIIFPFSAFVPETRLTGYSLLNFSENV